MNKELKQAIVNYMFNNATNFQNLNAAPNHFRQYIYTESGEHCSGGKKVHEFILLVDKLIEF